MTTSVKRRILVWKSAPSHFRVLARVAVGLLLVAGTGHGLVSAAELQAPRAARSVHLWYPAEDGIVFYNEVTVRKSVPGSYFCVCGMRHAYFGIQEIRSPAEKVVLFSVWDPGRQDDPDAVPAARRVQVRHAGDGVRISRFGNEGTGAKSLFPYAWRIGETCRCLVHARVDGERTTFAAYFYLNGEKRWKHLATFESITGGDPLKGYYSFVEDFRRDGRSAGQVRRAEYGNGWVVTTGGQWVPLREARFTADRTPTTNIDAGAAESGTYFLVTGGDTQNTLALRQSVQLERAGFHRPSDLPPEVRTAIANAK